MKFCAKCGAQMPDEAEICPQCNLPVFDPSNVTLTQTKTPKKKINNLFIIIPLTILLTALITTVFTTFAITHFVLPKNSVTESTVDDAVNGFSVAESVNTVCPADEYGNHDWSPSSCIEPSHCYECGVYKDDKLGNHEFYYKEDVDTIVCRYCDIWKDDLDNKE